MQRCCYECELNRHEYCLDVNCLCLACCAEDKEQDPVVWPVRMPYLPTCDLN